MLYLKGKPWELGGKGARCGLTSKLLSRTTDDCHPWHSNLCHGQMTTFILSVDRHVILWRFREEAPLFTKARKTEFLFCFVLSHIAHRVYWSYLSFTIIWKNLPLIWRNNTGFYLKLHYECLWYYCLKLYTIVRWNEKMMPSIEPTNMTGFLWVRGVTCCLNFHTSLISSVSQWTWHLMPLKNGIMNLSLSLPLSVWGTCMYSMCIVYSAPLWIRKKPLFNGTFSPYRGWVDLFLDDWAYCAFLFKLSAWWRVSSSWLSGSTVRFPIGALPSTLFGLQTHMYLPGPL